ncbi:MAG: DMT family transporter [Solirubrobacteraceae bacterium]|nr:DMT family transporter [Solirubrobacteraceae bacterium]
MRSPGTLLILASGVCYGAMAIFGKFAYDAGATVGTVLVVRFTLAAALFWLIVLAGRAARAELRNLPRRDVLMALGLGAVGFAIQASCYFGALARMDASLLTLFLYTFPAMVAVAAVVLGRDHFDRRRAAALALALGGLALVVASTGLGRLDALGVALSLAAAVVYSAYILTSEPISGRVRPDVLSALVCTGAAVTLAIGAIVAGDLHPGAVDPSGWIALLAIAVVSTVAAVGLFFGGLRRIGPTRASILSTAEPVVTVSLAVVVFGEAFGPLQVIGGALVLSAVFVLNVRRLGRVVEPDDAREPVLVRSFGLDHPGLAEPVAAAAAGVAALGAEPKVVLLRQPVVGRAFAQRDQ